MDTFSRSAAPAVPRYLPELHVDASASGTATAKFFVENHLHFFEGHFPGKPIVPAFVQLDWALRFAERMFSVQFVPKQINRLKFIAPLLPNHTYRIDAEWSSAARVLDFSFHEVDSAGKETACTKGKVVCQ